MAVGVVATCGRRKEPDDDFRLLVNELMRLMFEQELFTFVTAKPAEQPNGEMLTAGGTNNEAERTLRNPAQARVTGRTNKTPAGARRQTVLTSVLESLRLYLTSFTLSAVVAEVLRWSEAGRSCFAELLNKLKLKPESQTSVSSSLRQAHPQSERLKTHPLVTST